MKLRFQADADLNQNILLATTRREPTIDFQSSRVADLDNRPDPEVLAIAAREGRLLITHDQRTMPHHFATFITTQTSPGLLVVPQHLPVARVVEDLLMIWLVTEAEEWVNRISFLPI